MTFAYTSGNPDNLVGGNSAAMDDIQGPFYDIRTYLNSGALESLARTLLIVGEVRFLALPAAPALWLPCSATGYSRATYSVLFAAIGTTYGAGDGVNTFNVPDLTGRSPMGTGTGDAPGATAHPAGQKAGEETHLLSGAESGVQARTYDPTNGYFPFVPGGGGWSNRQVQDVGAGGFIVAGPASNTSVVQNQQVSSGAINAVARHNNLTPAVAIPAYIYAGQ